MTYRLARNQPSRLKHGKCLAGLYTAQRVPSRGGFPVRGNQGPPRYELRPRQKGRHFPFIPPARSGSPTHAVQPTGRVTVSRLWLTSVWMIQQEQRSRSQEWAIRWGVRRR